MRSAHSMCATDETEQKPVHQTTTNRRIGVRCCVLFQDSSGKNAAVWSLCLPV